MLFVRLLEVHAINLLVTMSKNVKTHSNKMINTPRTDLEEANQTQRYGCKMVKSDFARQLELELNEANKILTEWRTLCLWGGTPEIIHSFIKGQQERIYACQLIGEELVEAEKDSARLDWLADPKNTVGNVVLPSEYIMDNLDSMRAAIDAAMEGGK